MSPTRTAVVAFLLVLAGCAGAPVGGEQLTAPTTAPTTDAPTTEPHTAVGTSHTSTHLIVHDHTSNGNVTVTLAPDGVNKTDTLDGGTVDLTRDVHELGHDVRVVVERGDETVFNETVLGYESYELSVTDGDANVEYVVV